MGKEKEIELGGFGKFWREILQFGIYKRNQGRITRQLTFAGLAVLILIGGWRIHDTFSQSPPLTADAIPAVMVVIGLWVSFRLVNLPVFADFLIAVEAEMTKVSWPTRKELFHGSVVVIITLVALAVVLNLFDIGWKLILDGFDNIWHFFFG